MALRIKSSPFPWPMGPLLASPSPTLNPLPLPHSAPVTLAPCLRRLSRCRPTASSAVLPSLFFVTDLSSDITSVGGLTCLCDLKSLLPWSFYHVTLGLLTCLQFVSSARSHCATSPAPRTAPDKCWLCKPLIIDRGSIRSSVKDTGVKCRAPLMRGGETPSPRMFRGETFQSNRRKFNLMLKRNAMGMWGLADANYHR